MRGHLDETVPVTKNALKTFPPLSFLFHLKREEGLLVAITSADMGFGAIPSFRFYRTHRKNLSEN